jgi:hypothetical protein
MWTQIATHLRAVNLSRFARTWNLSRGILQNICENPEQTISVPVLQQLCTALNLDLDEVEQSLQAVRFNMSGKLEQVKFPFRMELYPWRALCHIVGDGNVSFRKDRPYPYLRWTQEVQYQQPMRTLLQQLSRAPNGATLNVNYPKALSYALLGTMPNLTFRDLKTPKFIQFVLDLPMQYRAYKVQFLAAFIVDDGNISNGISLIQKNSSSRLYWISTYCILT